MSIPFDETSNETTSRLDLMESGCSHIKCDDDTEMPKLERRNSSKRIHIIPVGNLVRQISDKTIEQVSEGDKDQFMINLRSYSHLSVDALVTTFTTNKQLGLSDAEADIRLQRFGENKLKEDPPVPLWKKIIEQFEDLVVLLLIASAVVSAATGQYAEFIAIMLIVIVNAVIGIIQEGKAESAVKALASGGTEKINVMRNGIFVSVDCKHIVPGDIIEIVLGMSVPADCIIFDSNSLEARESDLTGEPVPKKKFVIGCIPQGIHQENNMNVLFAGTQIEKGSGMAIVIGTGMNTFRGKTAGLIENAEVQESRLQVKLDDLGQKLGYASIVAGIVVFGVGFGTGKGADPNSSQPVWLQMLLIAVSLIVAAVPEGLPVCVSVALAIGMNNMAKIGCLVKGLANVEALGSVTDICTDKTGTLTTGVMTVVELFDMSKNFIVRGQKEPHDYFSSNANKIFIIGKICNETKETIDPVTQQKILSGNLTDKAVYTMAKNHCSDVVCNVLKTNPFDSSVKMASVIVEIENSRFFDAGQFCFVKGGFDFVMRCCNLTTMERETIESNAKIFTNKAYRVIGFAYKKIDDTTCDPYTNLTFCGFVGIQDPPRDSVPQAIADCKKAHVRVRMVTGDAPDTALAIAKKIGILEENATSGVIECSRLRAGLNTEDLDKLVWNTFVFGRALPEDKITIVESLQRQNCIVAMTGDGVNDSPALKAADMGVAMGSGTPVAKIAGRMILTNDDFGSIVEAIKEGRRIYANISKFVYFLLTTNPAEVFLILITTLLGLQAALSPTQILWLNLASDLFSALALIFEKLEPYLMEEKPRERNATMLNSYMFKSIAFHTVVQSIVTIGIYIWTLYHFSGKWNEREDEHVVALAQTATIYTIVICELLRSFTCRSLRNSIFSLSQTSNMFVPMAFIGAVGLTLLLGYVDGLRQVFNMVPLYDGKTWGIIIGVSVIPAVCDELFKALSRYMKWN